ncbi:DUF3624 domain-containing protein [Vibrio cincinnatiensis]|uniref:DUF3624 domain-containing protein n=1 Tax=Vibrio cincinnatiensis TaxID=675 RepID=UPI001EE14C86|nr:DUF3624 domain-containing protein [Vibrio cincinnatiensis]MCG3732267.1 DUF3624 domain-containing protein [Vibrio cincinnatiensis]MCG3743061.1 DUF3624 domain-containing protein [Vibrio cincinnatiensis]
MACNDCHEHWFWKKIGRCQRCMDQLTLLSVVCWVGWLWLFRENPRSISSISLLFAGFAFNALLFLHLWMKFVVLPRRRHQTKKTPTKKP